MAPTARIQAKLSTDSTWQDFWLIDQVDQNGQKSWAWQSGPTDPLVDVLALEDASHAQYKPTDVLLIGYGEDFSGGYGEFTRKVTASLRYGEGINADTRFGKIMGIPQYRIMPVTGVVGGLDSPDAVFMDKDQFTFIGSGQGVYRYDPGTGHLDLAFNTLDGNRGNKCSDLVVFKGTIYAAFSPVEPGSIDYNNTATAYAYSESGDVGSFVPSNRGSEGEEDKARFFLAGGQGQAGNPVLWRMEFDFSKVQSTTDPKNKPYATGGPTTWGSTTVISELGTNSWPRKLLAWRNLLVGVYSDRLVSLDSSGSVEILVKLSHHPLNGKGAHVWKNHILYPLGNGGLMVYTSNGQWIDISPAFVGPNFQLSRGQVTCLSGDDRYLYVGISDTATNESQIMTLKLLDNPDDASSWVWDTWAVLPYKSITSLYVSYSQIGYPKIWFSVSSASANDVGFIPLGNKRLPLEDTTLSVVNTFRFITPYHSSRFWDIRKALYYSRLRVENLSQADTTQLYTDYQTDGQDTWQTTMLGQPIATQPSDGVASVVFPDQAFCTRVRHRFSVITSASFLSSAARILSYAIYGRLAPPLSWSATFSIRARPQLEGKTQVQAHSYWFSTYASKAHSFLLRDPSGTTRSVTIVPPYPQESVIVNQRGELESVITIKVLAIPPSPLY